MNNSFFGVISRIDLSLCIDDKFDFKSFFYLALNSNKFSSLLSLYTNLKCSNSLRKSQYTFINYFKILFITLTFCDFSSKFNKKYINLSCNLLAKIISLTKITYVFYVNNNILKMVKVKEHVIEYFLSHELHFNLVM